VRGSPIISGVRKYTDRMPRKGKKVMPKGGIKIEGKLPSHTKEGGTVGRSYLMVAISGKKLTANWATGGKFIFALVIRGQNHGKMTTTKPVPWDPHDALSPVLGQWWP